MKKLITILLCAIGVVCQAQYRPNYYTTNSNPAISPAGIASWSSNAPTLNQVTKAGNTLTNTIYSSNSIYASNVVAWIDNPSYVGNSNSVEGGSFVLGSVRQSGGLSNPFGNGENVLFGSFGLGSFLGWSCNLTAEHGSICGSYFDGSTNCNSYAGYGSYAFGNFNLSTNSLLRTFEGGMAFGNIVGSTNIIFDANRSFMSLNAINKKDIAITNLNGALVGGNPPSKTTNTHNGTFYYYGDMWSTGTNYAQGGWFTNGLHVGTSSFFIYNTPTNTMFYQDSFKIMEFSTNIPLSAGTSGFVSSPKMSLSYYSRPHLIQMPNPQLHIGDGTNGVQLAGYLFLYTSGSDTPTITIDGEYGNITSLGTNSAAYFYGNGVGLSNVSAIAQTLNQVTLAGSSTTNNITVTGTIGGQHLFSLGSYEFYTNRVIAGTGEDTFRVCGTNQQITLPDCTSIAVGYNIRLMSDNDHGSVVITNATGDQSIRTGGQLNFKMIGVDTINLVNSGTNWYALTRAKIIWPNAQFSCTTNIPLVAANTAYPVPFNSIDFNNSQGIALLAGTNAVYGTTKMWITNAGQYEFSPSIVQTFNGNDYIRFWFRQDNTNVPNSMTVSRGQNGSIRVITVPFIVNVAGPTAFEIWAEGNTTGDEILAEAASGNYPACPSVICPIKRISDARP